MSTSISLEVALKLLAKFFTEEFSIDPIFVGEWLDNQSLFASEEERDSFIEAVEAIAKEP